ncbi:NUDIX domain-containing protein [Virgibacillus flavescens]|uniref:NUDIX domain-containing protein n=1 Tax=Virgibacillus flavescens TaxID=1611422 RepID=UPI003D330B62
MEANFCMDCGHKMETRTIKGTERKACTVCEFVFWGGYSVGVGALVIKNGKILLVRRAEIPGKGLWTNPGGYSEQMERIEETVIREVFEETGVTTQVKGVVALRDLPQKVHNIYIAFMMEYIEGDPVPDGVEVDRAGFYDLREMKTMNVDVFTLWLFDIALNEKQVGLIVDDNPIASLSERSFFRTPFDGE